MKKEVFKNELLKRYEREHELDIKRYGESVKLINTFEYTYIGSIVLGDYIDYFESYYHKIDKDNIYKIVDLEYDCLKKQIIYYDYIVENSDIKYESILKRYDEKLNEYEYSINMYLEAANKYLA